MKHYSEKERLEKSKKQSKEYEKVFGRSYEDIQKELGLKFPILFEDV